MSPRRGPHSRCNLSDGSAIGPLLLPVAAFNARGSWTAATLYTRNDVVIHDNAAYVVRLQHTSGATFDPNLLVSGEAVYQLLVSRPQGMFWRGVFATATAYAYYDVVRVLGSGVWLVKIPHTTGASEAFDPAKEIGGVPVYEALVVERPLMCAGAEIDVAVIEFEAAWAGSYVRVTYADGAVSVYVPAFGSAFPVGGARFTFARQQPTARSLSSKTWASRSMVSQVAVTRRAGEGAVVTLKYLGGDTWDVWGDLAPA